MQYTHPKFSTKGQSWRVFLHYLLPDNTMVVKEHRLSAYPTRHWSAAQIAIDRGVHTEIQRWIKADIAEQEERTQSSAKLTIHEAVNFYLVQKLGGANWTAETRRNTPYALQNLLRHIEPTLPCSKANLTSVLPLAIRARLAEGNRNLDGMEYKSTAELQQGGASLPSTPRGGITANSVDNYIRKLKTAIVFTAKAGLVDISASEVVSTIDTVRQTAYRLKRETAGMQLTPEQIAQMDDFMVRDREIDGMWGQLAVVWFIGRETGQRKSHIFRLKHRQIDLYPEPRPIPGGGGAGLFRGFIDFIGEYTEKSSKDTVSSIPISVRLGEVLESYMADVATGKMPLTNQRNMQPVKGSPFLFGYSGPMGATCLDKKLDLFKARYRAEAPWLDHFTLHDLRRTKVSGLLANGKNPHTIHKMIGMSVRTIATYDKRAPKDVLEDWFG